MADAGALRFVAPEAADYFKLAASELGLFGRPKSEIETSDCSRKSLRQARGNKSTIRHASGPGPSAWGADIRNEATRTMTSHNKRQTGGPRGAIQRLASSEHSPTTRRAPQPRLDLDPGSEQRSISGKQSGEHNQASHEQSAHAHLERLISSTSSTSSLPSISSSPSVSPRLVCPHLSLDDLLATPETANLASLSPHTVGLCRKCRLEAPPNIQSPLSPQFCPSAAGQNSGRRLVSDWTHRGSSSSSNAHTRLTKSTSSLAPAEYLVRSPSTVTERGRLVARAQSDNLATRCWAGRGHQGATNWRDDSLDCYLEPGEARRLQLSPTVRKSVEFIRSNSIESGRVVRVYKNGQPFERPLRVSIMRTEFANLDHLLDHINGRQLIPLGARYLFHLDGQLVYSVHELKHGSIYIVSGTRNFDHRANALLREQRRRELERHQEATSSGHQPTDRAELSTQRDHVPPARPILRVPPPRPKAEGLSDQQVPDARGSHSQRTSEATVVAVADEKQRTAVRKVLSKSNDSVLECGQLESHHSPKLSTMGSGLARTRSELVGAPSKRKKNVTFVDTGRGSSPAISNTESTPSDTRPGESSSAGHEPEVCAPQVPRPRALSTSEIGIQVSDSIDGFLIDLPIAMPAKDDDSSLADVSRPARLEPQSRESAKQPRTAANASRTGTGGRGSTAGENPKRRIVTIVERQLSSDELSQLRDLNDGDHHNESSKPPKVSAIPTLTVELEPVPPEVVDTSEQPAERAAAAEAWQYPGGGSGDGTPTERPVSQSGPNAAVCARVSTPTPPIGDSGRPAPSARPSRPLAPPNRVPVKGRPFEGLDMPGSNLELIWVNGFNINDQYPENVQQARGAWSASERFQNWVWHSALHDELVYPAGALVVLWSRRSNEQRHYARHGATVSALALCSQDRELAASAQLADPLGRPAACALVHLWSLASLDTLLVLDADQFRAKRIISLRLGGSRAAGCELAVSARDHTQVWLYATTWRPGEPPTGARPPTLLRASKLLRGAQAPLVVVPLWASQPAPGQPRPSYLLSFGRRHFHLWQLDVKQLKLRHLEPEQPEARLAELLAQATCLVRLAPSELLLGDSAGRLALLVLRPAGRRPAPGRRATRQASPADYGLDLVSLHEPADPQPAAITCLARVSGNLFCSADAAGALRFWRLGRPAQDQQAACHELSRLQLPADLGLVCAVVPANYRRAQAALDFYLVATSNAILFCSLSLSRAEAAAKAHLSLVYEGHETAATSLVADLGAASQHCYFTCSLDSRVCKWARERLVWKSLLPSPCASIAVHPVGRVLAVGSTDGTVYILDKLTGLLASYFPLTPVCINCLAYSRDGLLLAAGCSNGSIFILPVDDQGLKYRKVSILQSPHAVVSLQFSVDNRYILTSVTHGSYQELILWDLPNFRYMRDNVKMAADRIHWHDPICSGSEDVRAIWENANLSGRPGATIVNDSRRQSVASKRPLSNAQLDFNLSRHQSNRPATVVNLSCHRLLRSKAPDSHPDAPVEDFVIASDANGYLRLFRYPSYDIQQGFYGIRISSTAVNCCRFINSTRDASFVSTSTDGSICLWKLSPNCPADEPHNSTR